MLNVLIENDEIVVSIVGDNGRIDAGVTPETARDIASCLVDFADLCEARSELMLLRGATRVHMRGGDMTKAQADAWVRAMDL